MYNEEAGVVECDGCEVNIDGYGFSIGEGDKEPGGCYCWGCVCEKLDDLLNEDSKEASVTRHSETWFRNLYDLGVTV